MDTLFQNLVVVAFGALAVVAAVGVVFAAEVVRAAFALLFSLLGVAGLYVSLGADFLAGTQVLVYIGGILVLFIFAVMLTVEGGPGTRPKRSYIQLVPALVGAGLVFVSLVQAGAAITAQKTPSGAGFEPTTREVGVLMLTDFLLPFEVASIVLLVALIGAAVIARARR